MAAPVPGYSIRGEIYEGKRTAVFRAVRDADGMPVILKRLRVSPPPFADVMRLRHEERMLRKAAGPAVIAPLGIEEGADHAALVIEDFGAESLAAIHQRARLDIGQIVHVGVQVARALDAIHAAGIVHRDINPSNIVMDAAGSTVKVIDFGIASALRAEEAQRSNPNVLEGTLAYISPEQTGRMNRPVDYRTDFYSLGISLFELLIGWRPFQADDPLELVHHHLARAITPPHELNAGIPAALSAIVMKLVAKSAEDRYQTASGLLADLDRCRSEWQERGRIEPFEPGQADAADRLLVPARLYGRDRERLVLQEAFDRCVAGEGSFCLIEGEEGSGKSRLVQELAMPAMQHEGLFVAGKVDPLKTSIPFAGLVEALGELARYILASSDTEIERWREAILQSTGDNARILTDLVPEMGILLGPQPSVQDLPPVEAQNRFRSVVLDLLVMVAAPGRPFVMFLDDLQWADAATQDLLDHLLRDPRRCSLMVVGTMRNNDAASAGLRERLTSAAAGAGRKLVHCHLHPLAAAEIAELLTDTLGAAPDRVPPLAQTVLARTGGNPHFVTLFLTSLYERGVLKRDRASRQWVWDDLLLRESSVTENVARILSQGMRALSHETQTLLAAAACQGNVFSLDVLAGVAGLSPIAANELLWPVMRDGSIVPVGGEYRYLQSASDANTHPSGTPVTDVRFRFSHDRVREAAGALIGADETVVVHDRIGRLLYRGLREGENDDQVFVVATHLNHGGGAGADPEARAMRRRVNVMAGHRARSSSAFESALAFFQFAMSASTADVWGEDPAAMRDLYGSAAVCAYATGRFAEAEGYYAILLDHADTPLQRARVHRARVDFFVHSSRREDAIRAAMEGLRLVGVTLPRHPGQGAVAAQVLSARLRLRGRSPSRLLDAPAMTREEPRIALGILISLMNIAYSESPAFSGFVIGTMMNLTLRHGNSDESAYAYAIYGLFVGAGFGDYVTAREFGELSLQLIDRAGNPYLRGRCYFLMACLLNHWTRPYVTNLRYLDECSASAITSGDLHYASYALTQRTMLSVARGEELALVDDNANAHLRFASGIQYEDITPYFVCARRLCKALRGETTGPLSFASPGWDEDDYVRQLEASSFAAPKTWYWVLKLQLAVFTRRYEDAVGIAERMVPIQFAMTGQIIEAEYWLYTALGIAGLPERARTAKRVRMFRSAVRKLEGWAKHAPENFTARALLCKAEGARIGHDHAAAAMLYERAITSAAEQGFTHLVGLAAEHAAVLHQGLGHGSLAQSYRERAREAYVRWGAKVKAEMMGDTPTIARGQTHAGGTGMVTTVETGQGSLDILTLLKASHAIAGEIALPRILERLLTVVMENAGASRGMYVRVEGQTLVPEAEGFAGGTMRVLTGGTDHEHSYAGSVARYVARTGEAVTLQNDVPDMRFATDAYLKDHHPIALLCMPVVHHGAVQGVLYLENDHVQGAFSADRREMLRLLTGQIAISLENARLVEKEKDLARIQEQVRLAARIQSDLLPHEPPAIAGYLLAGRNIPAQEVGGDYFDFLETGGGAYAICVGDVSGKGLPASLLMANLQATLRGQVLASVAPGACLGRANTLLHRSTSPEKFATLILGVLDPQAHTFDYANAGQEHPFVVRADGSDVVLSSGGPPLAMLEWFDYTSEVYRLAPGDAVVIYSDGVPEAMDPDGVLFGHDRLHALLSGLRGERPEVMVDKTLAAVAAHTRGAQRSDDITIVILQRQPA